MNPMSIVSKDSFMDAFTSEDLIAAGYSRHDRDGARGAGEGGFAALWQKRVEDEIGTRYFINIREWDLSRYSPMGIRHSFDAGVQFHRDGRYFNFDYLGDRDDGIALIEAAFDELWEKMDCAYVESPFGTWDRHSQARLAFPEVTA